jgi:hypothetical protein
MQASTATLPVGTAKLPAGTQVDVYEFYDDFEYSSNNLPVDKRNKSQYFVLGKTLSENIVICYCRTISYVTIIHQMYLQNALKKTTIDLKQAIKYLRKDFNYQIYNIETINKKIKCSKDKYQIEDYMRIREVLQIKDDFYNKIISEIADNMYLHAKAKIIQKQFRLANSNPNNIICQHRLLHEFYAL